MVRGTKEEAMIIEEESINVNDERRHLIIMLREKKEKVTVRSDDPKILTDVITDVL